MSLTDAWLKANHKKNREKSDVKTDGDGLSARVSPKGKITWQLRYRFNGKADRADIGSYPNLSLKEARRESERLKGQLEKGFNPKIVLKMEKQAIITATSLASLYELWHESYCKKNKANHQDIKRSFEIHVFPTIGTLPAKEVTLHQWLAILEGLADNIPSIAERVLTNAKQMLKFGVKRHLLENNVLAHINAVEDLSVRKNVDTRSLKPQEIQQVWEAIELSRMATKNKLFLKLCLVFGCRNGELRISEKKHFDLENRLWIVPPENHKLGKLTSNPLTRPIIPEIIPLIEQAILLCDGKYLFTNSGSKEVMGRRAPLALPYNIMQWLRKNRKVEMEHWSVHSLRKTARTNWSTLTEPHVAEIMLGHKLPGEWQVYDHHLYIEEQAEAYSKWWTRLMEFTAR
ncbi:integrase family protein [Thalassotalea sp. G20_0]|uniref:tyrosine-type recombinase/integrase n=1 Tax=Thalassotalea sp. G20_0 TaxID=2821093 RepID=UPI001ADAAE25|nr:integrase family protein [Thalassotalea sp. G20_0]MBO9493812.1 integrase family protein [Thalassotalea sp. G20_0]